MILSANPTRPLDAAILEMIAMMMLPTLGREPGADLCRFRFRNGRANTANPLRRFPPPWTIEALDGGYKIVDANGQSLAYVYGHADQRDAQVAKALTLDVV